jgi:rhodanese-related sulfurtransferase
VSRRLLLLLVVILGAASPARAGHPWMPPLLTIDAESLQRMNTPGARAVVAVDVRPTAAYQDGRLPGARSIPLSSLSTRRGEVPANALVVLYGAAGHANVFVLEGGFAGWQAQGYAIER